MKFSTRSPQVDVSIERLAADHGQAQLEQSDGRRPDVHVAVHHLHQRLQGNPVRFVDPLPAELHLARTVHFRQSDGQLFRRRRHGIADQVNVVGIDVHGSELGSRGFDRQREPDQPGLDPASVVGAVASRHPQLALAGDVDQSPPDQFDPSHGWFSVLL